MRSSLRIRFLLASVGIATIPMIAIFLLLYFQSVSFLERQSIALNQEISYRVQVEIEHYLLDKIEDLLLLDDYYHFVLKDRDELQDVFYGVRHF